MKEFLISFFEASKKLITKVLDINISTGMRINKERQNQEIAKLKEIAETTIAAAKESGYFKNEFLPVLSEKIQSITKIGYAYSDPFNKNDCLTLEEKKALGLNTRRKYSRELINVLTPKGLSSENPNKLLENIWYANYNKVSRKYELNRLKALGLKYVEILDCCDEKDCKAIRRCRKIWLIDEVPELPLPGCDADYCRCSYIAYDKELLR